MPEKIRSFEFEPMDWINDTRGLSLAAKGAWIDLLCAMWGSSTRGVLTLSVVSYARLIGATVDQAEAVIDELADIGVCNRERSRDGKITLISRRIVREEKARIQNRLRAVRYREKHSSNAPVTDDLLLNKSSPVLKEQKEEAEEAWPEEHRDILAYLEKQEFLKVPMGQFGLLDFEWWKLTSECLGGSLSIGLLQRELPKLAAYCKENKRPLTQRGARKRVRTWLQNAVEWGNRAQSR